MEISQGSLAIQNLHADPKFILELASGLEDGDTLARKYGYPEARWLKLKDDPAFQLVVEQKRTELKNTGYVFKAKAALCAEDLLEDIYTRAKDPDTPLTQKLDAFKTFTKLGGLEPKEDKNVAVGPGFQITINLGDASVTLGGENVTQVTEFTDVEDKNVMAITHSEEKELTDVPEHVTKVLDLSMLDDIMAGVTDEKDK